MHELRLGSQQRFVRHGRTAGRGIALGRGSQGPAPGGAAGHAGPRTAEQAGLLAHRQRPDAWVLAALASQPVTGVVCIRIAAGPLLLLLLCTGVREYRMHAVLQA